MDDICNIGRCCSCLIKECTNPRMKKNHPSQGCRDWTRNEKIDLPYIGDLMRELTHHNQMEMKFARLQK